MNTNYAIQNTKAAVQVTTESESKYFWYTKLGGLYLLNGYNTYKWSQ